MERKTLGKEVKKNEKNKENTGKSSMLEVQYLKITKGVSK